MPTSVPTPSTDPGAPAVAGAPALAGDPAQAHDVAETLRARGMRMTPQRERVLRAVERLGHATPDAVAEAVDADDGPPLSLSTVYRNLEALERIGAVSHTHLDHRAPSYHLATHANHLHLVCLGCGAVSEAPVAIADAFARAIVDGAGFVVDVRHMAVHGWCARCEGDEVATAGKEIR